MERNELDFGRDETKNLIVMKGIGRRRMMMGNSEKGVVLPYDAQIEYLESTGAQYIDTGITPTKSLSFSVDFYNEYYDSAHGYGNVFGAGINYFRTCKYASGMVCIDAQYKNLGFGSSGRFVVAYDGTSQISVGGVSVKTITPSDFTPNGTIVLFATRSNSGAITQKILYKNIRCFLW